MEDYKKLYEDALAKAREIHRNENEKKFDMEYIFPELKESEDERIRKFLIDFIGVCRWTEKPDKQGWPTKEECVAWLEKQGEQKPVEWSEEDEEYLRRAINATKDVYPVTANWLKSLKSRYCWKPSEEQVSALERVLSDDELDIITPVQINLESLYEDLKKLKGE